MKKLIKTGLVFALITVMIGCKEEVKPVSNEEETEIADFDYSVYQFYPVENYEVKEESLYADRKLPDFTVKMMKKLFDSEKNQVFSPFNLYLNMSLMAGLTSGEAKEELLDLLGSDENTVLSDYQTLWKTYYETGGNRVAEFANSIWLSDKLNVNEEKLKQIADDYYVPGFRGDMENEDYTKAFQSWLNDNTGKMMGNHISGLEFDPGMLMSVASTIYYSNRWQYEYDPLMTKNATFHGVNGDVKVPFMNKLCSGLYVEGSNFTGIMDIFGNYEDVMFFLMPDKETSVTALLESADFLKILNGKSDDIIMPYITEVSMPRVDVDSKLKLEEILPELGVKAMFDSSSNSFSELSSTPMAVDKIEHACRLIIDEEGVKAAAYTVEQMYGGAPEERKKIVFDRPFIFMIVSGSKNVLFCGVINQL